MKTKMLVSLVSLFALSGVPLTAAALEDGECRSDTDCGVGARCEKAQWVEPCGSQEYADGASDDVWGNDDVGDATTEPPPIDGGPAPGENGTSDAGDCDTRVHEAEIGRCVTPPAPCSEDAECGEYEVCRKASVGGGCSGDDSGDGGWSPNDGVSRDDSASPSEACSDLPEQEEPSGTCGPGASSCDRDADCPREFQCVVVGTDSSDGCACVTAPCDCEPASVERRACRPKIVECEENDECPEDWVCSRVDTVNCSGGGAEPGFEDDASGPALPADDRGESGTPMPPADGEGAEPGSSRECTTVRGPGQCLPRVWSENGVDFGGASRGDTPVSGDDGEDDSPPPKGSDPNEGAPGSSTDGSGAGQEAENGARGGGCAVGPKYSAPSPGVWVMAIAALGVLGRRRRQRL
jgi:MYXO-CTERM domain-containing protein